METHWESKHGTPPNSEGEKVTGEERWCRDPDSSATKMHLLPGGGPPSPGLTCAQQKPRSLSIPAPGLPGAGRAVGQSNSTAGPAPALSTPCRQGPSPPPGSEGRRGGSSRYHCHRANQVPGPHVHKKQERACRGGPTTPEPSRTPNTTCAGRGAVISRPQAPWGRPCSPCRPALNLRRCLGLAFPPSGPDTWPLRRGDTLAVATAPSSRGAEARGHLCPQHRASTPALGWPLCQFYPSRAQLPAWPQRPTAPSLRTRKQLG